MTIIEDPKGTSPLVERVKAILRHPAATWDVIEAEPATIKGLYAGYVAPLAAIGPVCHVIGQLVFGATGSLGLTYRPPIAQVLGTALLGYVMTLAGVYVFALIVEALAPQFGAEKNRLQAFKLAAYSGTAAWVAGVFGAFPPLALLSIVGVFYGFYLLYLGVPKLTKVTGDKAMIYTVCAVIAALGIGFLVSILVGVLLTPLVLLTGGYSL
ncbi:MAG TPA: Yip1 family protein [Caulobacteraceae bacterium]|jgi:hypothetical protein|nr:Yip1 family protein [Caulobacteraceae bacterium]